MQIMEAFQKAIAAYYDGVELENVARVTGDTVFTKEYFDDLEAELVPSTKAGKKKVKEDAEAGMGFVGFDEADNDDDNEMIEEEGADGNEGKY